MKAFREAKALRIRSAAGDASGVLFTSEDAASAEAELLRRLEELPPGGLLPIDFRDVMVASEAARQLLRRALRRLISGEFEDRFIVLKHLGQSRYNVEVMLEREGLTTVERIDDEGVAKLLGRVEPAVRQTYEFLLTRETTTARNLQEGLGLSSISTATNRLTTLAKMVLARRVAEETVSGGGRQYVYAPVR